MGTQPGVYGAPISMGTPRHILVDNLTGGRTYYFSLTAVDNEGTESLHSPRSANRSTYEVWSTYSPLTSQPLALYNRWLLQVLSGEC